MTIRSKREIHDSMNRSRLFYTRPLAGRARTTLLRFPNGKPRCALPAKHWTSNKIRAGLFPIRATRESAFSDFAELVLVIVQAASALAALVVSVVYPGA
jgi:hypothetical protein